MEKVKVTKVLSSAFEILKKSLLNFGSNRPVQLAGTTAFFAIFSTAPILIIIISVFGFFTNDVIIRQKLFEELNVLVGQESTQLLKNAIDNYQIAKNSGVGAIIGVVIFLFSATTLFSTLQDSINFIWRVQVKANIKMGILNLVKTRILSFGVILCLGFVLLVSLIIDVSIAFLKDFLSGYFSPDLIFIAQLVNAFLSFGIITAVFALIYRFLPDVSVKWNASWVAAIVASLLFTGGKYLIGYIIGSSNLGLVYGAASSFVVVLVWIYYVSLIFYFGVELSHQYSLFHHHNNKPAKFAVPFEINKVQ
ncbi:MAG TPA: YihY/virulence factor BrkB family protein [Draconibacterium sp.]|nr:YihY/virulence factor BrkB family protein [Draconibacterium sp.]